MKNEEIKFEHGAQQGTVVRVTFRLTSTLIRVGVHEAGGFWNRVRAKG